jgi:hypothetical protein
MRKICAFVACMLFVQSGVGAEELNAPSMFIVPDGRRTCFQVLELEKLQIDPRTGNVLYYPADAPLYQGLIAVEGWLEGFISARQVLGAHYQYQGVYQWMTWVFSYCRHNPTKGLIDAGFELSEALRQGQ